METYSVDLAAGELWTSELRLEEGQLVAIETPDGVDVGLLAEGELASQVLAGIDEELESLGDEASDFGLNDGRLVDNNDRQRQVQGVAILEFTVAPGYADIAPQAGTYLVAVRSDVDVRNVAIQVHRGPVVGYEGFLDPRIEDDFEGNGPIVRFLRGVWPNNPALSELVSD